MSDDSSSESLQNNTADYIASAVRSIVGVAPFAGSLLSEIAGVIIPNQRLDRIAGFAVKLEERLGEVEREIVKSRLVDGNFTDLMEEGIRQAGRAVSDERKQYIANLIANSLTQEQVDFIGSLHLLKMLGELNDLEIIWLLAYTKSSVRDYEGFAKEHPTVLTPIMASVQGPRSDVEREAVQESYTEHLLRLGLLSPEYRLDLGDRAPQFNRFTGKQEIRGYRVTSLGRFLLNEIGLPDGLFYETQS